MSRGPWTLAAGIALAAGLAACGSDTNTLETGRQATTELGGVFKKLTHRGAPPPAATPEQIAQAGLAANAGPAVLVTLEAMNSTAYFALRGENGTMRTWMSASEQALITRDGILVGSRGFGNDMMSADVANLTALVLARQSGSARIELRYLDGLGKERPLPLSCAVTSAGEKTETFAGLDYAGTELTAQCSGYGFAFANTYLVSAEGAVVLSRQWIGPNLGHATLRSLTPVAAPSQE